MHNTSTSEMYRAAIPYIEQGWALLPVYGLKSLDEDRCLCGSNPCGLGNKHAGKHPVRGGWTSGPALTKIDAYAIWEEECPDYNIGVRTGEPSGFFAVDVEADGLEELAEFEAIHGAFPRTRVHRTGGGGKHYLFKMPSFEVRNNQKKLGNAIDIRGTGGMIVAPPSISGKGMYGVEDDSPIADAPAWLLEWLHSRLKSEKFDVGEMTVIEDLPMYSDLSSDRQQGCQRYALAVIEAEARKYATAPPGTGNAVLYDTACNILEVVQSPWNLYTYDHAVEHLEAARKERLIRRPEGGQGREEFEKTLMSARSKVIGKGRPLPADRRDSLLMDVSFSAAGSDEGGDATGSDPFMNPDGSAAPGSVAPSATPIDPVDPVQALLAEMLDRDGLDSLPRPQPLIFDVLDKDSETWLIAPSGGFKSFIALDMAIHVGMGISWRGKRVAQGDVVYIVAEGSKGIGMRVDAWENVYGRRSSGVRYLPRPVQVNDPHGAWEVLVEACRRLKPTMIVIDTQARVTMGMEENSANEMGVFVGAISRLREVTRACVMVVHHTGKEGAGGRGSSALYAAADTELRIERPTKREERLQLTANMSTSKQKDMEEDAGFDIQMRKVDLGVDAATGRSLSSLALEPYDPFAVPPAKPEPEHRAKLTENQGMLLDALREHANHENGATSAELRAMVKERYGLDIGRGPSGTALTELVNESLVYRRGASRFVLSEHALES